MRQLLRTGAGFVLSALLLWWTLHDQDLSQVGRVLVASNAWLFAASVLAGFLIFPLRAMRWRPILEPVVGRLPIGALWRSTAIGMMMNNVFPLRAGEFARAFALTREAPHVPITTALGSLAVDRIFDALVVFALMFVAMLDPRFPAGARVAGRTIPELATGGMVFVLLFMLGCYLIVLQPARVLAAVRAIVSRIVPRFADPIVRLVEHGVGGLAVLRDTRRFLVVLLWAIAHWLMHALALYLGFQAVGIAVPFTAALFLQGVLAIGVAVPSSPGFFGVFELAATMGLEVYGVPKSLAVSWALGYHLLSFIPITVIGAMYFARLGLSVQSVRGAQEHSGSAPLSPADQP